MDTKNQKVTFSSRMKPTLKSRILEAAAAQRLTPSHYLESLVESVFQQEETGLVTTQEDTVEAPNGLLSTPIAEEDNWSDIDSQEELPPPHVDAISEEKEEATPSHSELKEEFDLIVELGAKIAALKEENSALNQSLDEVVIERDRLISLDETIDDLEEEKTELIARLETNEIAKEELNTLKEKVAELEEENAGLYDNIEEDTLTTNKDIADLKLKSSSLEAEKKELVEMVDLLISEKEERTKLAAEKDNNCIVLSSEEKEDYEQFMVKLEKSNPELTRKHLLLGALGAACYNEKSVLSFYYIGTFLKDNPNQVPSLQTDSLTSKNLNNE